MDDKVVKAIAAIARVKKAKSDRLKKYVPNNHPQNDQLGYLSSPADIVVGAGGNGSGKTLTGLVRSGYHLTGWYPDWFPQDSMMEHKSVYNSVTQKMETKYSPVDGRIVAASYLVIEQKIQPELIGDPIKGTAGLIPPELLPPPYGNASSAKLTKRSGVPCYLNYYLANGSTLDFISLDQKETTMESVERDFAFYDEPVPQNVYEATQARLFRMKRRGSAHGRSWMGLTPLEESSGVNPAWIHRRLVRPYQTYGLDSGVDCYEFWTEANHHLGKEALAAFKSQVKGRKAEARLYGRFMQLSATIYDNFDHKYHVIKPHDIEEATWYLGMDFHIRRTTLLWLAALPTGDCIITKVIQRPGLTTSQAAELAARETHVDIYCAWADADKRSTSTGRVERDEINQFLSDAESGVYFRGIKKDKCAAARSKCYDMLEIDHDLKHPYNDVQGAPRLYVFSSCTPFIDEILDWSWDHVDTGDHIQDTRLGNAEKTAHCTLDAWRYIIGMGGGRYLEKVNYEDIMNKVPDPSVYNREYMPKTEEDYSRLLIQTPRYMGR